MCQCFSSHVFFIPILCLFTFVTFRLANSVETNHQIIKKMGAVTSIILIMILLFSVGMYCFYSTIFNASILPGQHVLDNWSRRANLLNDNIPNFSFPVLGSDM